MLSQLARPHGEALKRKIKDFVVNSKGEFKTLFIVPFENGLMVTLWMLELW